MSVVFLALIIPIIYRIFKKNLKATKIIFSEIKPEETKCKVYLFPICKTKKYRSV